MMNIQRIMDKFSFQRKLAKLDKQRKTDIMNIQRKYCIEIKADKYYFLRFGLELQTIRAFFKAHCVVQCACMQSNSCHVGKS